VVRIAGETLQVYFLGTAGALPTPNKNPACIMVKRGSDTLLFDCGEGAQQQMMRARTGFTVDGIFISHWHADHFLGVFGLVQTLSFMGRSDPLVIFGPAGVHDFVDIVMRISKNRLNFSLEGRELQHGAVVSCEGYHVRAFSTSHGMSSIGYILKEDERPGKFDRERAIELGIPPGPLFGRLQRGESISIVRNGEETPVRPGEVMGPPRPGRTVVYTGDTRPGCQSWKQWAEGADLLIHDATYDDSEAERAREVYHSTAGEAADVAVSLGAGILALVHISSRYTSTGNHIRDAEKRFDGEVIVPDDRMMLDLPFRG
jgi:ribonuclease Z